MRIIENIVEIEAPIETVWLELTKTDAYADWNPFITRLEGALQVGSRLTTTIRAGKRQMTFRPTVVSVEHNRTVQWLGRLGARGIFDGRHEFHLEPLSSGATRFTQREVFSGILVGALRHVLADTEAGFEAMNNALRDRAERTTRTGGILPSSSPL